MRFVDRDPRPRPVLKLISSALAGVLALGIALAGCGEETAAPTADSSLDTGVAGSDADVQVVPVTGPVFETVAGGQFDLGSIEGTDTVLWFWAPW